MLSVPTTLAFNKCFQVKMLKKGFKHLLRKESLFGSVDSSVKLLDSGIYPCQFATDVRKNSMWKQLQEL